MAAFLQEHYNNLYIALLADDRWKQYLDGLGLTLLIAACATLIGILIGMIVAVIKVSAATNRKLRFLEMLCDFVYRSLYIHYKRNTVRNYWIWPQFRCICGGNFPFGYYVDPKGSNGGGPFSRPHQRNDDAAHHLAAGY